MEEEIENYIVEHRMKMLKKLLEENFKIACCKHLWDKYGWGYKCRECSYYTGTDDKFNKLIKKLLTTKKK